ncbi:MAG: hypothetical protein WCJ35_27720, partial [Planctomycetota bacterium]
SPLTPSPPGTTCTWCTLTLVREQVQDKVHGIACDCEQFVRERPLRSVLMAAGIGWLLGRLWKGR